MNRLQNADNTQVLLIEFALEVLGMLIQAGGKEVCLILASGIVVVLVLAVILRWSDRSKKGTEA